MFLKEARRTVEKHRMLNDGDRVLVAVSGGPDSVALLHLLVSMKEKRNLSLSVAHLNHMLRGKSANEDARYVERLSEKLGLPFFSARKNVRSFMKKTRLSPEEAARKLRYEFLWKVARIQKAGKVALGHTADDQAETVLLALIRGAGLAGLAGIPPVRPLGKSGILVVRPLIDTFRAEIERYLKAKGITPRLDASNLETVYLRNRVRLELLPLIGANYNPGIKSALVRLAAILREDNQYLLEESGKLAPELLDVDSERRKIRIDLPTLKSMPPALQQRLIREAINVVSENRRPLSLTHWECVRELAKSGRTGSYLTLPELVVVKKEYGNLLIMKECLSRGGVLRRLDYELEVPGSNYIPDIGLSVDVSFLECGEIPTPLGNGGKENSLKAGKGGLLGTRRAFFDRDRIRLPLHVRFRTAGDSFQPLGMRGNKKLKDFFIDRKVPAGERDEVPLLLSKSGIIWVMDPGGRGWGMMADEVKVTKRTVRILKVEIEASP
jgi:tRNA(Ile)-lysidine synthase